MINTYYVYILANKKNGTLYVGVTNDLERRISEHKLGIKSGFPQRYGVKKLVYYETFGDINDAIGYEKRLKRWRRDWKLNLIEDKNPRWKDLTDDWK